jgi:hypothetical protein
MHIGFSYLIVKWITTCVTSVSFIVLINGATSNFFKSYKGLRQGFPLSPFLFLLVAYGLSKALDDAKKKRTIKGISIGRWERLTHLLFVNDEVLFCFSSE